MCKLQDFLELYKYNVHLMYLFKFLKSGLNNVILTRHRVEYIVKGEKEPNKFIRKWIDLHDLTIIAICYF